MLTEKRSVKRRTRASAGKLVGGDVLQPRAAEFLGDDEQIGVLRAILKETVHIAHWRVFWRLEGRRRGSRFLGAVQSLMDRSSRGSMKTVIVRPLAA